MALYSTVMPRKIQPFYFLVEGPSSKIIYHLSDAQSAYFEPETFQLIFQILRRIVLFIWESLEDAHDLSTSSILLGHLKKLGFADWIRELTENLVDESCINVHRCHLSFTLCFVSTQALIWCHPWQKPSCRFQIASLGNAAGHLKARTRTLPKDIFRHVSA